MEKLNDANALVSSTIYELVDDKKEADRRLNAANALVASAEQQLSILNSRAKELEDLKKELEEK
jgi:chromosome segregation ATPase